MSSPFDNKFKCDFNFIFIKIVNRWFSFEFSFVQASGSTLSHVLIRDQQTESVQDFKIYCGPRSLVLITVKIDFFIACKIAIFLKFGVRDWFASVSYSGIKIRQDSSRTKSSSIKKTSSVSNLIISVPLRSYSRVESSQCIQSWYVANNTRIMSLPELKAPEIDRMSIVSETVLVKFKSGPKSRDKLILSSLNWLPMVFFYMIVTWVYTWLVHGLSR